MSIKYLLSLSPFKGRSASDANDDSASNDNNDNDVTWDTVRHRQQTHPNKTRYIHH